MIAIVTGNRDADVYVNVTSTPGTSTSINLQIGGRGIFLGRNYLTSYMLKKKTKK